MTDLTAHESIHAVRERYQAENAALRAYIGQVRALANEAVDSFTAGSYQPRRQYSGRPPRVALTRILDLAIPQPGAK